MCHAVPGKIISTNGLTARVSFNGAIKNVNLIFCPRAKEGDYVSVHVGIAQAVINEDEANEVLALLTQAS